MRNAFVIAVMAAAAHAAAPSQNNVKVAAAATSSPQPASATAPAASVEANKAAYRSVIEECLNKGNLAAADRYIAKDMVDHNMGTPTVGIDGFKQFVTTWRAAFPDARMEVQSIIGEGDRIMARITCSGTQTGTFNGMAPTNRHFSVDGYDEVLFRNGKAVEHWGVTDQAGMMRQLGMMPASAQAPAQGQTGPNRPSSAPAQKPGPSSPDVKY